MKDLKATRAAYMLQRLIDEGEHTCQDFKFTVNDPRKIARTVSAFANNQGGRLLIGVTDNGEPRGVRSEEDIYVVEAAAKVYCKPASDVTFSAIRTEDGATVIRADIPAATSRPVRAVEPDGHLRAYFRVADENIVAHSLMVRAWRAQSAGRAVLLDLSEARTSILEALRAEPLTPEALAARVNISSRTLEQTIIDMVLVGLLRFEYRKRAFYLVVND